VRESDCLEPGMHTERTKNMTNVVADRLDAQIQLAGDVVRPAAVLEQAEHLGLTGGQMWVSGPRRRLVDIRDLAEDPDHAAALHESDGAHLDSDPLAVCSDDDDLRVMSLPRPSEVAREDLSRATRFLWRDDRSELPPADVAYEPARSGVQPADDPRRVDDVARDADRFEGAFDIPTERLETGSHEPIVTHCLPGRFIPSG